MPHMNTFLKEIRIILTLLGNDSPLKTFRASLTCRLSCKVCLYILGLDMFVKTVVVNFSSVLWFPL